MKGQSRFSDFLIKWDGVRSVDSHGISKTHGVNSDAAKSTSKVTKYFTAQHSEEHFNVCAIELAH
jgi:hypothetical protein